MTFTDSQFYLVGRTLVKTFIATVLGQLIVFGSGILNLSSAEWKAVLAAGVAAVLMTAYNALNPSYTDYGLGRSLAEENELDEDEGFVFEEDADEE